MRQLKDESSSANKFLPDRAVLIVADPKVVTVIAHRLLDISKRSHPVTIAPNRAVGVMTLVHLDAQLVLSDGSLASLRGASSQRSKIHMLLVRALDKAHREAALPGRDCSAAVRPSALLACVHMGRHTQLLGREQVVRCSGFETSRADSGS